MNLAAFYHGQLFNDLLPFWFPHSVDGKHGERFGYLRRDGVPSNTLKDSLWKSFFHHPRALWRCHRLALDAGR